MSGADKRNKRRRKPATKPAPIAHPTIDDGVVKWPGRGKSRKRKASR